MLYLQKKGGVYVSVGDNIRRCRKEKGWTQARLAQELQVSQQMIGQFEKSKNPPKIETIEKIAVALSVSPIDLIGVEQWEKEKIAGLAKEVEQLEQFDNFLKSVGYESSYKVTKWHWEDENEKASSEKVQVPDEVETVLSKDGNTATFTEQEFEDLQECVKNGAKETLERLFYKRALEQQQKK